MAEQNQHHRLNRLNSLLILGLIWVLGNLGDRLWLTLDHSVPSWDPAKHLIGSLNHWWALQHPQFLSGDWWNRFLMLSSKYPIFTYIATAPFLNLFGTGADQAMFVNLLISAILLGSVYGLGKHLFNSQVGLWAAGLCLLLPYLYTSRTEYLLDYPLTAMVAVSFWCLTLWRDAKTSKQQWLWIVVFGICFGLTMMVKETALFFLLIPLLWVVGASIRQRDWRRLIQLMIGLLVCVAVFGPWYRTNWLFILSSFNSSNLQSAVNEGDPPLNTLAAWIYYWKDLPAAISWPLLLVPLVGLLLSWRGHPRFRNPAKDGTGTPSTASALRWIAVFYFGSYLICSAIANKESRYIMPYLPVVAVFLAYGLTQWPRRFSFVRWGTVGVAIVLMGLNLFPIGGSIGSRLTQLLSPNAQHYAYLGPEWPHPQVIDEIIKTEPYLRSNLGVLPASATIDQHNFNYYGALRRFQVYGRQVGTRQRYIPQDVRSLSWFLTKTGDQGIFYGEKAKQNQAAITQTVEQSPEFQLQKSWQLPDGDTLKLYHRQLVPIQVQPLTPASNQPAANRIQLNRMTVPAQTPPGKPVPITYEWSGPWEQLRSGLVLLTWKRSSQQTQPATQPESPPIQRWLHDHAIGLGNLYSGSREIAASTQFQVIERTAMLPPTNAEAGTYTLEATYLNRQTGASYPIAVPAVTVTINPSAAATPAPEVDWVTQLRNWAIALPQGPEALEPVFDQIGQINLYDPIQDYTVQAQQSLNYRLQQEPQNLEFAYGTALATVLQRRIDPAIAALKRVVQLDAQNPYAYGYLAFVNLYDLRPGAAQAALQPALALNPSLPEIQGLNGVAALMRGNLIQAWHSAQIVQAALSKK